MGAVRFSAPVRLSSLRVIPDGVECPGGVGHTSPGEFTLEILLNVAPSDPVNALARTSARVTAAPHALEYALDMPEGTATRLVVLRAPARRITLSLYAHADEATPMPTARAHSPIAALKPCPLRFAAPDTLLASLSSLDGDGKRRALAALALLAQRDWTLVAALASPHIRSLLEEGGEAASASILGLDTPHGSQQSLAALLALPSNPWGTVYPLTEAPLARVLRLAEAQAASTHPRAGEALATTIGRLFAVLEAHPSGPAAARLTRALPPLVANAVTRGSQVSLPASLDARVVLRALLPATATVAAGMSCAPAAQVLAAPFLPLLSKHDPLRRAWEPSALRYAPSASASPMPRASPLPTVHVDPPQESQISPATVSRVQRCLDARSGSILLSPTPAELLAAIAPGLLGALSTAKTPPLGIPASRAAHGSASDYAGKVYSAHEFRREREMVSGLGVGASSAGRKASRHVDDFGS
ncbi:hypothetical protein CC85DRAFT_288738 [Cutaneotrichosporon oleaginosum]|uniref:Uncharacterized protein n=1 Tax=Cutaneotrichosporon oleaginosum TaxID=879819 RepID=A0A0J0XE09_9TREE|nr:uncharacterized protein CC85DRAFT_288738 [Cutaneotrichosporon oleaginosum]KLT39248.1 hypothetical protein CC85DRAFT_288738 [Cutaneotrichosporon oleaginosum]TXT09610.1 hypothetical protein COLE_03544 [Cutaneotrichosporon oleaginosum]